MIEAQGISKEYRSGRGRLKALDGVTFSVETGKTLAVAGKSGSGKTTLLNCIGGLERPDEGRVVCFGIDILALSGKTLGLFQRGSVGFVFQRGNLLSYLTVSENIGFPLALNGVTGAKRDARVQELLERIGLGGAGKAMPHELSGGEVQRVSFARAIAHRPRMVLADEPTASLDSSTAKELIELMIGMGRDQSCTLVVSTHDVEIMKLADDTVLLRDGRVTAGPRAAST